MEQQSEIVNLMDQLIKSLPNTRTSDQAKDTSLPYLVQSGEYNLALEHANALLLQNRGVEEKEPHFLFQTAFINQAKSGGKASAELATTVDTYNELLRKYPESDLAFLARKLMERIDGSLEKYRENNSDQN